MINNKIINLLFTKSKPNISDLIYKYNFTIKEAESFIKLYQNYQSLTYEQKIERLIQYGIINTSKDLFKHGIYPPTTQQSSAVNPSAVNPSAVNPSAVNPFGVNPSAVIPSAYPSAVIPSAYPSAVNPSAYPSASSAYPSAYPSASSTYPSNISKADIENLKEKLNYNINFVGKKIEYINKYNSPIQKDIIINTSIQTGGNAPFSDNILKNFNYNNLQNNIISNNEFEFKFIDEINKVKNELSTDENKNKYMAKGYNSVVYAIHLIKTSKFEKYINKLVILKLFNNDVTGIINKYNEDIKNLPNIKNNMVDILYYGQINIDNKIFYYIITPLYETNLEKLKFPDKIKLAKNVIKTVKYIYDSKYIFNDLAHFNIGYDGNMNMIIIDYDTETLTKKLTYNNFSMPKYIIDSNINDLLQELHLNKEITIDTNKKLDKFYSVGVADILFHLVFVHLKNQISFYTDLLQKKKYYGSIKKDNIEHTFAVTYLSMKNWNEIIELYENSLADCIYSNVQDIFYNKTTKKGLLAESYENIHSLDEISKLLDKITYSKIESYLLTDNVSNNLKKYNISDSNLELTEYGYRQNNFINENLYQFVFFAPKNNEKLKMIEYYLTYNRWSIVEYENDSDIDIIHDTLKYALQTVGCIHSIEFDNNGPIFKVHINKDFRKKYGFYFDNCRIMENNILTLIWWCINITDLFNLVYLKTKKEGIQQFKLLVSQSPIYINIVDHPIIKNDLNHPFVEFRKKLKNVLIPTTVRPNKPIYCWPSKKGYSDIGLPFHDILMFLFEREFSKQINISTYLNYYNNKNSLIEDYKSKQNKGMFRGSFTNCVDDDLILSNTPRIKAHIKSLQNSQYIDAYVVKFNFNYINFSEGQINTEGIDLFGSQEKFMIPIDQLKYKIILNLDGFASAFRIIQELYYNSCIIIPDSEYTDVLRDCLIPWKHYVPCKGDLSNLVNTIKWCVENDDKVLKILENLKSIRDAIISMDNMITLTQRLIMNPINKITLTSIAGFNTTSQIEYKPDNIIEDDTVTLLSKKGTLSFVDYKGNKSLEEVVHYKKYIKYKQKYLTLKNKQNK